MQDKITYKHSLILNVLNIIKITALMLEHSFLKILKRNKQLTNQINSKPSIKLTFKKLEKKDLAHKLRKQHIALYLFLQQHFKMHSGKSIYNLVI